MELLGLIGTSLVLGFGSSGHCLLMCGPVQSIWLNGTKTDYIIRYHLGRWISYVLIGSLLFFGKSLFQLPQWTSQSTVVLGLSFVFGACIYFSVEYFLPSSWTKPLLRLGAWGGQLNTGAKMLFFGILNGFLPCGMVWMAAGMAVPVDAYYKVVLIMVAFGVGTLPAQLGIPFVQKLLGAVPQKLWNLKWSFPVLFCAVGLVLIFRGVSYQKQLSEGNAHEPSKICAPAPEIQP
jgi:sulfite exporter TauE/SafE